MMKLFLLVAGVFLLPVALSYGVDPAATLPKFMTFTVEGTDQTHIFRALMGLYLGMVTFCIIAAFTPAWRHVAVIWAVFFAYSLAIGQILSLIVDGMPSPILLFYLAVELTVGTLGASGAQKRAAILSNRPLRLDGECLRHYLFDGIPTPLSEPRNCAPPHRETRSMFDR